MLRALDTVLRIEFRKTGWAGRKLVGPDAVGRVTLPGIYHIIHFDARYALAGWEQTGRPVSNSPPEPRVAKSW